MHDYLYNYKHWSVSACFLYTKPQNLGAIPVDSACHNNQLRLLPETSIEVEFSWELSLLLGSQIIFDSDVTHQFAVCFFSAVLVVIESAIYSKLPNVV